MSKPVDPFANQSAIAPGGVYRNAGLSFGSSMEANSRKYPGIWLVAK